MWGHALPASYVYPKIYMAGVIKCNVHTLCHMIILLNDTRCAVCNYFDIYHNGFTNNLKVENKLSEH